MGKIAVKLPEDLYHRFKSKDGNIGDLIQCYIEKVELTLRDLVKVFNLMEDFEEDEKWYITYKALCLEQRTEEFEDAPQT